MVSSFLLLIPFQLSLFRYFKGLSTKGYQWFLSRHLFSGFLVSTYVRFFFTQQVCAKNGFKEMAHLRERGMSNTRNIMDEPIEEINVPILRPTRYDPRREPPLLIYRNFNRFADWIVNLVPAPIRRRVDRRIERLRSEMEDIYARYRGIRLPRRTEAPLRGYLNTYRIDGQRGYDQTTFVQYARPRMMRLLRGMTRPIKMKLILTCRFQKGDDTTDFNSHANVREVMQGDNIGDIINSMIEKILANIEKFQNMGSGWQFESVVSLDINVDPYSPLGGASYIEIPKELAGKHAIINPRNERDNKCFMWSVTSAAFPKKKDPQRIGREMMKNAAKLNWEGIVFPTPLQQVYRFERQNPYSINVYGWDGKKVYPLRIGKIDKDKPCINLLLLSNEETNHYCSIKNMSALTASQYNKHKGKRFICDYCCNSFQREESLQKHEEYCSNHKAVRVRMPEKGTKLVFKKYNRRMRVPFIVYADFEALPEGISTCQPSDSDSYTNKYQKHKPCGFCYYIKCFNDELFLPVLRHYTITHEDESVGMAFVNSLVKDIRMIYKRFRWKKDLLITHEEEREFQEARVCHICELLSNDKVKDHCHLTGRYRGAAHTNCNLEFKLPKFYPVIFHNLSGYDTHMFIKDLAEIPGEIDCISKTEEKYISFTKTILVDAFTPKGGTKEEKVTRKIRFVDSLKFMASSLEKLVNNLSHYPNLQKHFRGPQLELVKRKGVYPYDYMNCIEKLGETCLPPIECWYSRLNDSNISEGDFEHANKVWDAFGMKTMRDYHDLYLKTDTLLLADVFESFRDICLHHYKLDPAWYFTAPGLAWDACLKMTQVELELLHDQDMLLMVEKGIRGGVSMISTRFGRANNKYMTKDRDGEEYDPGKPSTYIPYLDANNLYGYAMSKKLPTHGFRWMTPTELEYWSFLTCIVEVDLEYPLDLHDLHNDYPLAPDHLQVGRVEKLIPNLYRKENYVVHYEALKTYVKYGLKVTKIHRGIVFHDSPWMKPYIDFNTKLRMQSKNNFEKDFFKLMNNSVFGKTMEDVRKRTDIKLVTTPEQASKFINKPNYTHRTTFSPNLVAIHMGKTEIHMVKPVYLGMCILDISKTLMYEFYYGYIKPKYGEKVKLLFTDTDSLMFLIETEDFYKDIAPDVHKWFDTSNFPPNNSFGISTGVNKMVIGMFKDEVGGKIVIEFVGLRAKNYSYLCDGEEYKKCKGIKKSVTERDIHHEDYINCLFEEVQLRRRMNVFQSHLHDVYSKEINKIALSANDDKRVVLKDGVHTLAHGHFRNYMRV